MKDGKYVILYLDDDQDFLDGMRVLLEANDYVMLEALSAEEGLKVFKEEKPDIVLVDIIEGFPQGKALDITQAGPLLGFDSKVVGTNDWKETAGSDIVIIVVVIFTDEVFNFLTDDIVLSHTNLLSLAFPTPGGAEKLCDERAQHRRAGQFDQPGGDG